jgi:hypothetical protein
LTTKIHEVRGVEMFNSGTLILLLKRKRFWSCQGIGGLVVGMNWDAPNFRATGYGALTQ